MPDEATKAVERRIKDEAYREKFIVGYGIDIGAGNDGLYQHKSIFTKMLSCKHYDVVDGDAQYMVGYLNACYDFVHSAHCLEHMHDPYVALKNWVRILKVGGHLIVTIPDEDLYEQGIFPSTFNGDHKVTFTIWKNKSWCDKSINVNDLIKSVPNCRPIRIMFNDEHYQYGNERYDQTGGPAECSIEFILRKES